MSSPVTSPTIWRNAPTGCDANRETPVPEHLERSADVHAHRSPAIALARGSTCSKTEDLVETVCHDILNDFPGCGVVIDVRKVALGNRQLQERAEWAPTLFRLEDEKPLGGYGRLDRVYMLVEAGDKMVTVMHAVIEIAVDGAGHVERRF